eukprot:8718963-Alexandrium_andersonii.AAC.1
MCSSERWPSLSGLRGGSPPPSSRLRARGFPPLALSKNARLPPFEEGRLVLRLQKPSPNAPLAMLGLSDLSSRST